VRDGADSQGLLDRETRERRPAQKARTKRKTYSREDVTDARARRAGRGGFQPVGVARLAGWLGQRPSGPQGRPAQN
jgi:hypothetical protein